MQWATSLFRFVRKNNPFKVDLNCIYLGRSSGNYDFWAILDPVGTWKTCAIVWQILPSARGYDILKFFSILYLTCVLALLISIGQYLYPLLSIAIINCAMPLSIVLIWTAFISHSRLESITIEQYWILLGLGIFCNWMTDNTVRQGLWKFLVDKVL